MVRVIVESPAFVQTRRGTQVPQEPQRVLLGRYEVKEIFPRGQNGTVYKAWDTQENRFVAVKEVNLGNNDATTIARREFEIGQRLNCDGVAKYYSSEEHDGNLYVVREWGEGQTLRELGAVASEQRKGIMQKVLDIVESLHAQGFVLRDLKASNVCVDEDGVVKLFDIGGVIFSGGRSPSSGLSTMLGVGSDVSTAPEVFQGATVKISDIYSCGSILAELCMGHELEYDTERLRLKFEQIGDEKHRVIVERAMKKEEAERYQTIQDMRTALLSDVSLVQADSTSLTLRERFNQVILSRYAQVGMWGTTVATGVGAIGLALYDHPVMALTSLGIAGLTGFGLFRRRKIEREMVENARLMEENTRIIRETAELAAQEEYRSKYSWIEILISRPEYLIAAMSCSTLSEVRGLEYRRDNLVRLLDLRSDNAVALFGALYNKMKETIPFGGSNDYANLPDFVHSSEFDAPDDLKTKLITVLSRIHTNIQRIALHLEQNSFGSHMETPRTGVYPIISRFVGLERSEFPRIGDALEPLRSSHSEETISGVIMSLRNLDTLGQLYTPVPRVLLEAGLRLMRRDESIQ